MVSLRKFGAGQPLRRREDRRFLTGGGRFTDDIDLPGQAIGYVLRSPHAHARIRSINIEAAHATPGVLAVLTGADAAADGLGDHLCIDPVANRDGSKCVLPACPMLARDRVRHVGDIVALIISETLSQAREAAEMVRVDYEPLPAVVETTAALRPEAPRVWEDAPNNICADWAIGDFAECDRVFAAAHVTVLELVNNRVLAMPMEPRGAIGLYHPGDDRFTLYTSGQGSHNVRDWTACPALNISANQLRVITPDVGGGFGMKAATYREQVLVLWAAKRVGRPVKWISDRSEAFLSDAHARDHVTRAELALDDTGRFLAVRVSTVANMGAHLSTFGPAVPTEPGSRMLSGCYDIPVVCAEVKCVFTHTTPVDAYRGAGRPEAAYVIERLVAAAARELAVDPGDLRARNFIRPAAFPHTTATGLTYDSGDYARNLAVGLAAADWNGFGARRKMAREQGKLRGIGLAYFIEICGMGASEMARITFDATGDVTLAVGTQSNGQGHETAYAQLVAALLGIPIERIRLLQGDTDAVRYGRGTGGSNSLQTCGPAILRAAEKVIEKGRRIAAHLLEAAEADIEYADLRFTIAGTDRSVPFDEVRERAFQPDSLPIDIEPGLDEQAIYNQVAFTFPNGCHVCEVEVDPETGAVEIANYVTVDDFGRVLNPLLVAGQVHGGLAQGLGQALMESCAYDASGQLLTGSFMDYCMPRADRLPAYDTRTEGAASPANPLGVKGCAEAGTVGGPPAVINAIVDALAEFGVRHIDMPATPERIWRAIKSATP